MFFPLLHTALIHWYIHLTYTICMFAEFRVALVQLGVTACKKDNLSKAAKLVSEAAQQGAKIVALPVSFFFHFKFFTSVQDLYFFLCINKIKHE